MIKDSGERREFDTGAVRDIQEGKGRCDLMPLGVIADAMGDKILADISMFVMFGDGTFLNQALIDFSERRYSAFATPQKLPQMFLDVAKHFEDGAKKYGENNWQKGIPVHCYIDSAVRHYLKYSKGDTDEPHDRAFVWNILCCKWTIANLPELDDISHYALL